MPWYFYNGTIPVPVQRVDGEIVSVRPRTHIEAKPEAVRKFGTKMSRTGPPKGLSGAVNSAPLAPPSVDEIAKSPLAAAVSELGVTKDPAVPPAPLKDESEGAGKSLRRLKSKTVSPGVDE